MLNNRQDPNLKYFASEASSLQELVRNVFSRPMANVCIYHLNTFLLVLIGSLFVPTSISALAQELPDENSKPKLLATSNVQLSEAEIKNLKGEFDKTIEELRAVVKRLDRSAILYTFEDSETAYSELEKWEGAASESKDIYSKLREQSLTLFLAIEKPDEELTNIVKSMTRELYQTGRMGLCYTVSKKLYELDPQDARSRADFGRISLLTNDFDNAGLNISPANAEKLPELEKALFSQLPFMKQIKADEMERQKRDAELDEPLPQVKFVIRNKGEFIMELFEDEAPETVGNFVSVVDAGFYDGMIYHKVIPQLLCETGVGTLLGQRSIGYSINNEYKRKDRRNHFRGSVAMAIESEDTSSGSMFYVTRVPTPGLNTTHTVFGRVVSGMDVVDSLNATVEIDQEKEEEVLIEGAIPDIIESATVIRRRAHGKYEPKRVE